MSYKATKLRELFAASGTIRLAGAHHALGAKLAERTGFDGVWSSGLEISTSYCVPDANILTMSEYLATAESMNDAVSIPIVADCDTGYGNSNNVIHMVRKYEAAGIAAVCIEDKHFPKVNSFIPGRQELAPISEFVGKIMAAKNAQRSSDFMVIARVEALIAGWGQEEALKRAHAYAEAGADAILIHSKAPTPAPIVEFIQAWNFRVPLVVVPTTYYTITAGELEELGVKMVIYANHGIRAAIRAMEETFAEILRAGSTTTIEPKIAPMKLVFELQGMPQLKRDEEIYLRSEEPRTRAIIPAAGDHLDEYSMKHIAADIPMAVLDINGKPLLQRQLEVLNNARIADVTVVGGYKADKIQVDGVKPVINNDWQCTGIAHSFLVAGHDYDGRTLMVLSDILFDADVLGKLLKSDKDITLLVDRTYSAKSFALNKKLSLVVVSNPPPATRRSLDTHATNTVLRIGKRVPVDEAHDEFAGLVLFSKKGYSLFRETYQTALANGNEPFHEAPSVQEASFTDVIQEIIDQGYPVHCVEVSSGWMEIHSFDDYRQACALLAGR